MILAIIAAAWFFKSWQHRGEEMKRQKANYENLLNESREAFSQYKFKTDELEEYLKSRDNQFKGLYDKLDAFDIKLRRIEKISSTRIVIQDSTNHEIVLDSINSLIAKLESLKAGEELVYNIDDKTKCFEFHAQVLFADGSISHRVLNRKAVDTMNHVTSWERKKHRWVFGFKTGLFGKKIHKVNVFNNCGFSKTIVLN